MNNREAINPARIGARMKSLRLQRGLRQEDLAVLAGIHRPRVSRVECGWYQPDLATLERLCTALGEPIWVLFTEPSNELSACVQGACQERCARPRLSLVAGGR